MTDASSAFSSADATSSSSLAFSSLHSHLVSSSQSLSGSPGGGWSSGTSGAGSGSGSIGMGIIAAGFSTELDALRHAYASEADAVAALQTHYRAALRCEQARVVSVGAFGLLLELPRAAADRELARQRGSGGGGGETVVSTSARQTTDAAAIDTNAVASMDAAAAAAANNRPKRGRKATSAATASSPVDASHGAHASSSSPASPSTAPTDEPLLEVHDASTKSARRFRTGALARLQQRTHESFAAAHALELALWQRLVDQLVAPRHASRAARVLAAARALAGVDVAAAMAETARLRGCARVCVRM